MISAIHHFAIIASSEESLAFYEKLGFHEIFRRRRANDTVVLLEGLGVRLEIFVDPRHPPRAANPENLGLRHLALRVDSIEATAAFLGLSPGPVMTDWVGERFCYIADPDGLPIELHE